jgi:hypothetical protein
MDDKSFGEELNRGARLLGQRKAQANPFDDDARRILERLKAGGDVRNV